MSETHDIGDYQTRPSLGTFGFLPRMSEEEVHRQISYLLAKGWTPAIEHEHPSGASDHYWTMWKLPFFGERDLGTVTAELEACHRAYPDHHIRLIGYDNKAQTQGTAFVVYEGGA